MDLDPIQTPEVFELMRIEIKLLKQLERVSKDIVNREEQLRLDKQYRDNLYYWLRSQGIKVPLEKLSEITGQPPSTISGITRMEAKNPTTRPTLEAILRVEPDPVQDDYVPPKPDVD